MSSCSVLHDVPQTHNLERKKQIFQFLSDGLPPDRNRSPTRISQAVNPTHGHPDLSLSVAGEHALVPVRLRIESLPAHGDVDVVHRLPNEGQQFCGWKVSLT